jgi:hypothetical protein
MCGTGMSGKCGKTRNFRTTRFSCRA